MELKYGNKRVFEISLATAIAISFCVYFATEKSFIPAFGVLIVTLWTFRGVIRYFYCSRWIQINASINKIDDQTNIRLDWRGTATNLSQYKVNIQYSVDEKLYETDIFLNQLPENRLKVYYKPENPEIVSPKVGLGWEGITFISCVPLLVVYGIIN